VPAGTEAYLAKHPRRHVVVLWLLIRFLLMPRDLSQEKLHITAPRILV
jgi:hypothetical protein